LEGLQLQTTMSAADKAVNDNFAAAYNKALNGGKAGNRENLGMNDFLKILTTQLSHQDPAAPMEDKEFIAQMAQFSSLKEMTNMTAGMSRLTAILSGSEAAGALGRSVELVQGGNIVRGTVNAVARPAESGGMPQVLVNGQYYGWEQVSKVFSEE